MMVYELDDLDRALVTKVRKALEYDKEGTPIKDAIDDDEILSALELLMNILESGFVS